MVLLFVLISLTFCKETFKSYTKSILLSSPAIVTFKSKSNLTALHL